MFMLADCVSRACVNLDIKKIVDMILMLHIKRRHFTLKGEFSQFMVTKKYLWLTDFKL